MVAQEMSTLLIWLIAAALCYMLINSLLNCLLWPRLKKSTLLRPQPSVSILIPARNEVAKIDGLVQRILAQTYESFQLCLLDDQSSDGTASAALAAAAMDARFELIHGTPLPVGWLGKNWACHQLTQVATGDILVFTDADVCWQPDALNAILAEMENHAIDALCVWPTQITETWAERLTVPLMALTILAYAPMWLFNQINWPGTGIANGQCLLFWRRAYDAIGGHAAVRDAIVEDVTLAQRVKQSRRRLRNVDGGKFISCRMYHDWRDVLNGFGKNILAGHANSLLFLFGSTIFHWAVFVVPWIWLLISWRAPFLPLLLVLMGLAVRAITAYATDQRLRDALLMPVSVLLMTRIAAQALYWRFWGGGLRWKGRIIG